MTATPPFKGYWIFTAATLFSTWFENCLQRETVYFLAVGNNGCLFIDKLVLIGHRHMILEKTTANVRCVGREPLAGNRVN